VGGGGARKELDTLPGLDSINSYVNGALWLSHVFPVTGKKSARARNDRGSEADSHNTKREKG